MFYEKSLKFHSVADILSFIKKFRYMKGIAH